MRCNVVFTVAIKRLSFKQDISDINSMLSDQQSTYAILRYAFDIPTQDYSQTMDSLYEERGSIIYPKLLKLVTLFKKFSSVGMVIETDEIEKSLAINPHTGETLCDWDDYEFVTAKQPLLEMEFD